MAKRKTRKINSAESTPLDAAWLRAFRRRLLTWYARNARDLPWRRSRDVYQVWVSEIMLQQTQVATVESYFRRFVAAFPSIADLAAANEQEVLRLWEGLGYYRRARQLHRAAREIVEQHGGHFPRDMETVRKLPGIGRYTAGAILSIAFDQRAPILEANTERLFARLIGYQDNPKASAAQSVLWSTAERLLPRKDVGLFNQALMELGSLVCAPKLPDCETCPVAMLCVAQARGLQASIPPAKAKQVFEAVREACVVVYRRGRVLIRHCGPDERWTGLWDFPRFEIDGARGSALQQKLKSSVARITGVEIRPGEQLATIKHGVTRFRITLYCFEANYVDAIAGNDMGEFKWLRPAQLADYPLSTTGRKIADLLTK
jgi:A/G-specific adenine glycosylase